MEVLDQQAYKKIPTNDPIIKAIMESTIGFKNVSLKFLESKKKSSRYGDWIEYNLVLDCFLASDTSVCILNRFLEIVEFLKKLSDLKLSSVGIQETKCDEPNHLYLGIYVIKDVGNLRNIPEYDMTKEIINLIENDEL